LLHVLALEFPRGTDDLFLKIREFAGAILLSTLLPALAAALHVLALAKDFFKGTDFAKVKIARGTAKLAIGSDVIGPEEPGDEFIWLNCEIFQTKNVAKFFLLFGGRIRAELDEGGFFSRNGIADAVIFDAEVVPDCAFEWDFLQWRRANVAPGGG
jgi:hypothetical protein